MEGDKNEYVTNIPNTKKSNRSDEVSTSISKSNIHFKKILLNICSDMKSMLYYEQLLPRTTEINRRKFPDQEIHQVKSVFEIESKR